VLYQLVTLWFSGASCCRRVAIIGVTPAGLALEKSLWESPRHDIQMLGFFDARSEERFGYPTRSPLLGDVDELLELARKGLVDEVYLALPLTARERINHYLYELSDTTVDTYLVPDFYEYGLTVSHIDRVGDIYTFSFFDSPFEGGPPCSNGLKIWCWVHSSCCSSLRSWRWWRSGCVSLHPDLCSSSRIATVWGGNGSRSGNSVPCASWRMMPW